jgi:hypothetical protein
MIARLGDCPVELWSLIRDAVILQTDMTEYYRRRQEAIPPIKYFGSHRLSRPMDLDFCFNELFRSIPDGAWSCISIRPLPLEPYNPDEMASERSHWTLAMIQQE